jgi:tetratricopeptide (TPR) repeat protein
LFQTQKNNIFQLKRICLIFFIAGLSLFLFSQSAFANRVSIKRIHFQRSPFKINISLTGKASYKVIKIDDKQVLVAFKNTLFKKDIKKSGTGRPFFKWLDLESNQRDVTIIVNTSAPIENVSSRWNGKSLSLTFKPGIEIEAIVSIPKSKIPFVPGVQFIRVKRSVNKRFKKNKFTGTVDDFIVEYSGDFCKSKELDAGIEMLKNKQFDSALKFFDNFTKSNNSGACAESSAFLKAYAHFKTDSDNLKKVKSFQDAISYYPESKYLPYAFAALGQLQLAMDNRAESLGYYKLILKNYNSYTGMPEVYYQLGLMHLDERKYNDAISKFAAVIDNFEGNVYVLDAQVALGKVFFLKDHFINCLTILNGVLAEDPKKLYQSSDLLYFIGHANYEIGRNKEAEKALMHLYNLYPNLKTRDEILTKVGDTFVQRKIYKKAIKIYGFVIKKFPKSKKFPKAIGFLKSSLGMAQIIDDNDEKKKIYNMIINDFKRSPFSKVAMLRLASLQKDLKEYVASIETVKTLLKLKMSALKPEAISLMQQASELLYEKYLAEDDYPEILKHYEINKRILIRSETPRFFELVGTSYYKSYLYIQSLNLLITSYKLTPKGKRSSALIHKLMVSMHETGRIINTMQLANEYIKNYPNGEEIIDIYKRIAIIALGKKEYRKALINFNISYRRSITIKEKADILIEEVKVFNGLKDYKSSVMALKKAINLISASPEKYTETVARAQRKLGDNYMKLKSYVNASDAFSLALKLTKDDQEKINIKFLLAEAYRKGSNSEKAIENYQSVLDSGDDLWANMAQERINEINLSKKLK